MFAKKLHEILEIRGMSGRELARKADVSPSLAHALLNGKHNNPSYDAINKMSYALGISPEYFFDTDTLGPQDILSHLSTDERKFILNQENLPFVKLTKEAKEYGLSPADLEEIISLIKKWSDIPKK